MRFWLLLFFLCLCSCQQMPVFKTETGNQKERLAKSNIRLGIAYLNQGERPRAKAKLLKALKVLPDSVETNDAFAYYLEVTGDIKKAAFYHQRAMKLSPTGAPLNNYGSFLCRQGKYQEAERFFLAATQDLHYLNSAGAFENAGLCAMKFKDYQKAIRYFRKALTQDPSRKQALYELEHLERQLKHGKAQRPFRENIDNRWETTGVKHEYNKQ